MDRMMTSCYKYWSYIVGGNCERSSSSLIKTEHLYFQKPFLLKKIFSPTKPLAKAAGIEVRELHTQPNLLAHIKQKFYARDTRDANAVPRQFSIVNILSNIITMMITNHGPS